MHLPHCWKSHVVVQMLNLASLQSTFRLDTTNRLMFTQVFFSDLILSAFPLSIQDLKENLYMVLPRIARVLLPVQICV